MENAIKKIAFSTFGLALVAQTSITQAIDFGSQNVKDGVKGTGETADIAVQNLISTAATFLAIVAVLYALYGGWNILTAGGEEDKVKKGKTILIQALIGLVVIFLANSIVQWLITKILVPNA
jgi:Type IV secretion system pilin